MKEISMLINTADKRSLINPEIYGHFSEHLGRCIYNGMYVGENSEIPNINGVRKDVIEAFNEEKIVTAIRKAMLHTDKGEDMQLIRQITDHISFKGDAQMTVEAIQDLVEMELMKSSRKDVAQKYIAYRNQRSIARKAKTRDMFLEIINIKSNDITRENANMNADTPAGMMMKFASETTIKAKSTGNESHRSHGSNENP